MNWIDCNEREPIVINAYYLVKLDTDHLAEVGYRNTTYMAFFNGSGVWDSCDAVEDGCEVIAWMPLPDPQTGYTLSQQERDVVGLGIREKEVVVMALDSFRALRSGHPVSEEAESLAAKLRGVSDESL